MPEPCPTAASEFAISTDKDRLDRELIHSFLTRCYWAKGIPKETFDRSIENSLCFGLYRGDQQIGFARVISDFATYAYLGDVFVIEKFRGQGLSKLLLKRIRAHPNLQGLRRWSLVTRDVHGLYARFGFRPIQSPERHMEIHDPEVYRGKRSRQHGKMHEQKHSGGRSRRLPS
ncbi:MAG: GNAT family N-acetyltransferase [Acidobacteria bacterium]|nr:GNAT family N-acetyltransferase [Acidobacteriota bacterium]